VFTHVMEIPGGFLSTTSNVRIVEKAPDEATPPSLSKKQHRRAQVRKAQM